MRTTTLPFQPPEVGKEMLESPKLLAGIIFSLLFVYRHVHIFLRVGSTLHVLQYHALVIKHSVNWSECFLGAPVASFSRAVGWLACGRPACSRQTHTVHYQGRTSKGVRQLLVGSAAVRCVPCSSCVARAAASALVCNWYCKRCSYEAVICNKLFFFLFFIVKSRKCLRDIYEHAGIIESLMFCWLKHKLVLFAF